MAVGPSPGGSTMATTHARMMLISDALQGLRLISLQPDETIQPVVLLHLVDTECKPSNNPEKAAMTAERQVDRKLKKGRY